MIFSLLAMRGIGAEETTPDLEPDFIDCLLQIEGNLTRDLLGTQLGFRLLPDIYSINLFKYELTLSIRDQS